MVLLIATLSANAQFGEPDFDAKYATDLASDFLIRTLK